MCGKLACKGALTRARVWGQSSRGSGTLVLKWLNCATLRSGVLLHNTNRLHYYQGAPPPTHVPAHFEAISQVTPLRP